MTWLWDWHLGTPTAKAGPFRRRTPPRSHPCASIPLLISKANLEDQLGPALFPILYCFLILFWFYFHFCFDRLAWFGDGPYSASWELTILLFLLPSSFQPWLSCLLTPILLLPLYFLFPPFLSIILILITSLILPSSSPLIFTVQMSSCT